MNLYPAYRRPLGQHGRRKVRSLEKILAMANNALDSSCTQSPPYGANSNAAARPENHLNRGIGGPQATIEKQPPKTVIKSPELAILRPNRKLRPEARKMPARGTDLQFRKPLLYPAELRGRDGRYSIRCPCRLPFWEAANDAGSGHPQAHKAVRDFCQGLCSRFRPPAAPPPWKLLRGSSPPLARHFRRRRELRAKPVKLRLSRVSPRLWTGPPSSRRDGRR